VTVTADGDVAIPLAGLAPDTSYRWGLTATSTGGKASATGSFRTPPLQAMPPPALSTLSAAFGTHLTVSGTLPGKPGLLLTPVRQPYPFTAPPAAIPGAATATDAQNAFSFDVQALRTAAYGVTAEGFLPLGPASLVRLKVFPALTVKVKRARHHRFVVSGRYRPDVDAKVTLYRRGHGRVGQAIDAARAPNDSRTFRFFARALKPGRYEVRLAVPKSEGVDGTRSAGFTIPRR
jgi:hypothetical protein